MARDTRAKINRPIQTLKQDTSVPERERVLDFDALLTAEDKARIRREAELKIRARDTVDAEDAYLKQEMARLDKEAHPEVFEPQIDFVPDLPEYANPIKINGREYWSGFRYDVTVSLCAVLKDVEFQAKRHLRELEKGNSLNQYRQRNLHVNPDGSVYSQNGPARF